MAYLFYSWSFAKECSNYRTIALISHASKVMLKILQARLQQYMNCELPDVQAGFKRGIGTRNQIANISWIIEKAREFQKNIYFCFIDYTKAFDCVDHKKLWKILKEMGMPDHLTCLLSNFYMGQQVTDWSWNSELVQNLEPNMSRLYIVTPFIFASMQRKDLMWNAELNESQAGIKNINNLRYAGTTTLMAENE